jgi:hypothetical protein
MPPVTVVASVAKQSLRLQAANFASTGGVVPVTVVASVAKQSLR